MLSCHKHVDDKWKEKTVRCAVGHGDTVKLAKPGELGGWESSYSSGKHRYSPRLYVVFKWGGTCRCPSGFVYGRDAGSHYLFGRSKRP